MIRPEMVPLLVVALLLIAAQPGVETVTTVVGGDQSLPDDVDAVIVVDGTVSVPPSSRTTAAVYVVGGTLAIAGTHEGRLSQLAGTVRVAGDGAVQGRYQQFGGELVAAPDAAVDPETVVDPLAAERSPAGSLIGFLLQAVLVAAVAFGLGRRVPDLLDNVATAIRAHPVVGGTVGLLASVTLLSLFVFMAFTIILIPVSVLGLVAGLLVMGYAYVAVGHLAGRLVPSETPGMSTAVGAVGVLIASRLVGFVPVVGEVIPLAVLVTGLGAVLITYFGLRRFEPPTLGAIE